MKKSLSRFLRRQNVLRALRSSNFAKSSGAIILRKKPPGNERKICRKNTLTSFLANPNLEDEIHSKGGRFVTPKISFWGYY